MLLEVHVGCSDSIHNNTNFAYGIVSSENYFIINNANGAVSLAVNARDLPGSGPHTAIIILQV